MHELLEEHARDQAYNELTMLRSLRLAIPAALDSKARPHFESRESALLKIINY